MTFWNLNVQFSLTLWDNVHFNPTIRQRCHQKSSDTPALMHLFKTLVSFASAFLFLFLSFHLGYCQMSNIHCPLW